MLPSVAELYSFLSQRKTLGDKLSVKRTKLTFLGLKAFSSMELSKATRTYELGKTAKSMRFHPQAQRAYDSYNNALDTERVKLHVGASRNHAQSAREVRSYKRPTLSISKRKIDFY